MLYKNKFNYNKKVSGLGFGCMRFPMKNNEIDLEQTQKMFDLAIEQGITYFDTAYNYHGGKSELICGKCLKKYERESFSIATKLPCWLVDSVEKAESLFNEQLEKLQMDYVDFYLLHSLSGKKFDELVAMGIVEWGKSKKAEGKIKNFGFSFHDEYLEFEKIINHTDWDFCQIQYNYVDVNIQAGKKGYDLATEKGIPVIVMEPLKGGLLSVLPEDVGSVIESTSNGASLSSVALRWVSDHENVAVALSGMSTIEQMQDNLNTYNAYFPLSQEQNNAIETAKNILESRVNNGCSGCEYCLPCPFGVEIPRVFSCWNGMKKYNNEKPFLWRMKPLIESIEKCKQCEKCQSLCPQKLSICDDLQKAKKSFEEALAKNAK